MGKTYDRIDGRLRDFIDAQPVFFVATAPVDGGHVNVSPKGRSGSLTVLDERTVAYLDFGGSGAETIAHLRENGRITLMWCAFDGPPNIVRVHGTGEPVFRDDERFPALAARFPDGDKPAIRAVIVVTATRISDTCGFAVPFMEYRGERTLHEEHFGRKSDPEFAEYCAKKPHVGASLDGLPALPLPLPPRADLSPGSGTPAATSTGTPPAAAPAG
ncbi:pyridoxamine 5'-phosphate oxidase family protein [Actinokineospora sp. UTMC 2448]|uniref:pyridoxamine 5'-phosphate oxidase family protein n=1 Tax=Actinokineospora sp. UTMC 2448 TaxID=2268449 RepID=UPI0021645485|nr:pyridoxamine 5'-phosphate oxidase family protein [Actinokineospora sp. UTMC 2448]UVS80830.1 pyridoxamine 5'-phosphate oxidase, FMN-binding family [Actinokineospora sp. UTMC 2448]